MTLKSKLESLLFTAVKPLALKDLASALKVKPAEASKALEELADDYKERQSGIRLTVANKRYQLTTSEDNAGLVKEFLHDETSGELSAPSLETLTIIAYRGPVSKQDLDRIRGVNCSLIIRNLLMRGLIIEKYDKKLDDNFYSVTHDFVRFLGLDNLSDLPDYEKLHAPDTLDRLMEDDPAAADTSSPLETGPSSSDSDQEAKS